MSNLDLEGSPLLRARLIAGMVVALAAIVLFRHTAPPPTVPAVIGSASAEVSRRLRDEFHSPFAETAVLVFRGLGVPVSSDSGRALVRRVVTRIGSVPGVNGIASPASLLDTMLIADHDSVALAIVGTDRAIPDLVPRLRGVTDSLTVALRPLLPQLHLGWTGERILLHDFHAVAVQGLRRAELIAVPLTLVAAWWAFGGAGAALLAIALAGVVAMTSQAVLVLLAPWLPVTVIARTLAALLGVALTLEYVLWRRHGGWSGRAIFTAAGITATAFAVLSLAPLVESRGAAIGGLVATLLSAAAAGLLPVKTRSHNYRPIWLRIAAAVTRHPVRAVLASLLSLAPLCWAGLTTPLATRSSFWLPTDVASAQVLAHLDGVGRGVTGAPLLVVIDLPPATPAFSEAGWQQIRRAVTTLRALPGVGDVRAITTIGTGDRVVAEQVLPEPVRSVYLTPDRQATVLQVIPLARTDADATDDLVRRVRQQSADALLGAPGGRVITGGLAAYAADHAAAMRASLWPLIGLVSLGTLIALLVVFRAPLVALKALSLNLVAALAAVGVVVLAFPGARDGLPVTVPLLAFGAAFAVSIDWELLLLFAMQRAMARGQSSAASAVSTAVVDAGPVMVRGGMMLALLFGAFAISSFVPLGMTGTALAAAVVLEITVVRLVLAPALLVLAGRWNWWPKTEDGEQRTANSGRNSA